MIILLTGGSGYIGSRFVIKAMEKNHGIISASRTPIRRVERWVYFDINNDLNISVPEDVDVVVHLAANTTSLKDKENKEVMAAKSLITAASAVGARFIFVSSQTARADAPTSYGRRKWCIEQEVMAAQGLVVRFGQVYGANEKGLFGTLAKLTRNSVILPSFTPSPMVQPIHVDDCAKSLLKLIDYNSSNARLFQLGSVAPIPFTKLLSVIAKIRVRKHRIYIKIPTKLILLTSWLLGTMISTNLGLLRLSSLFDLPVMNTENDLQDIEIQLRPLESGMHPSGSDSRRKLIIEALVMLQYILKEKPNFGLVRRYVLMIEKIRGGELGIPTWMSYFPASLSLLDGKTSGCKYFLAELSWRTDAATIMAEASCIGGTRFLGSQKRIPKILVLSRIILAVIAEVLVFIIRLILPTSLITPSNKYKKL